MKALLYPRAVCEGAMDHTNDSGAENTWLSAPITRRRLLGGAARLAALGAAALMPPHVQRLLAEGQARSGSLRDIKHVVLLMQENRSFDHYFGTMAGVRGFDDPDALTLPNGQDRLSSARSRASERLPAAVSSRHAQLERAEDSVHQPRAGRCSTTPGTADRWTTGCPRTEGRRRQCART